MPAETQPAITSVVPAKYRRTIHEVGGSGRTIEVDVYAVLAAFPTGSPAIDHAVKKLLCAGARGHKSRTTDLAEAIVSIQRELENEGQGEVDAETQRRQEGEELPAQARERIFGLAERCGISREEARHQPLPNVLAMIEKRVAELQAQPAVAPGASVVSTPGAAAPACPACGHLATDLHACNPAPAKPETGESALHPTIPVSSPHVETGGQEPKWVVDIDRCPVFGERIIRIVPKGRCTKEQAEAAAEILNRAASSADQKGDG